MFLFSLFVFALSVEVPIPWFQLRKELAEIVSIFFCRLFETPCIRWQDLDAPSKKLKYVSAKTIVSLYLY